MSISAADLDWKEWLSSRADHVGFCQTLAWARINAAVNGAVSSVLSVNRGGMRVGGALISRREIEKTSIVRQACSWFIGTGAVLDCYEGPVFMRDASAADVADLLAQVSELGRRSGVDTIRFITSVSLSEFLSSSAVRDVFKEFGYVETPWLTRLLDLTKDERTLHAELRQAARKGIRKSAEAGLKVTLARTYDEYRNLFCAAYYEESGLDAEVGRRCEAFWRADEERSYRFFVVHDDTGQVHATLGTYRYQGMATEIMSRRTAAGVAANLPAQDLLHWSVICHHRSAGDHYFNLAGYNPSPANSKEEGIRRFKEKWGGEEYSVPTFTWTRNSPSMRIARWLRRRMRAA